LAIRLIARDAYDNHLPHSMVNTTSFEAVLDPGYRNASINITVGSKDTTWVMLR
jgi:hypothetical protein